MTLILFLTFHLVIARWISQLDELLPVRVLHVEDGVGRAEHQAYVLDLMASKSQQSHMTSTTVSTKLLPLSKHTFCIYGFATTRAQYMPLRTGSCRPRGDM